MTKDIFTKAYLHVINEDAESVGDEYTNLVQQVVAEQEHWDEQKKNAAEELLVGFRKVNKDGMLALQRKAAELLKTPAFMTEYAEVVAPLINGELPINMEEFSQLEADFAEMMENPNHDARRKMLFKATEFLDGLDAKAIVKLNEMETKLRELFNKYSQF